MKSLKRAFEKKKLKDLWKRVKYINFIKSLEKIFKKRPKNLWKPVNFDKYWVKSDSFCYNNHIIYLNFYNFLTRHVLCITDDHFILSRISILRKTKSEELMVLV